ncbi:hypothetical protein MTR67_038577 [Solanum verrucosum]|uniref:Uncharacterized protein n=1 Tax=Solanum verrucosum TaxID=315347 RepID=A0AAF0UFS1_SOLVR|nr:hypothetical protein MTR67_038577 [Solanum verrucosum]
MDFLKCSIAGLQYGTCASNVELAAAKQSAETWPSGQQFFFPSSNSDGIQNSNHLDFTSKRKQMSVTIQHETGQILRLLVLFVKFINVAYEYLPCSIFK